MIIKDIKQQEQELKDTKKTLNFFKLFGVDESIRHIIGATNENPLIVFKPETKTEYLRIMKLLKPSVLDLYLEQNGCTGFNPILKTDCIKEDDKTTLLNSGYVIETKPDKYSQTDLKISFYIEHGRNNFYHVWVEAPLSFFEKYPQHKKEIVDTYETEQARRFNYKHKDIMTHRLIFNDLPIIEFYGGNTTHYSNGFLDKKLIENIIFLR